MASKKISQLPLGTPLPSDVFPFVQSGVTKKGFFSSVTFNSFVELTYSDANNLVSTSGLIKGGFYKITDRGDNGILLQAIDVNQFSFQGVRYMLCPDYQITGNMLGIWNGISGTTTFNPSDIVIYGGYYWENLNGNVGSSLNIYTLDSEWSQVSKSLSNGYVEKTFIVNYDFTNDWIEYQFDENGNEVGVSYEIAQVLYSYNPCDHSDWNISSNSSNIALQNNKSISGFMNNCDISGNPVNLLYNVASYFDVSGGFETGISNNIILASSLIGYNNSYVISNNTSDTLVYNDVWYIGSNDIGGGIESNVGLTISNNTNNGDIDDNECTIIFNNSNNGTINGNRTYTIEFNTNLGDINYNEMVISSVSVSGDCNNNSGNILNNTSFIQSFSGNANGNVVERNFGKTEYTFDFSVNPLISGTPQYFQSIPSQSKVSQIYAKGNGLSSATNTANITIGVNVDDPNLFNDGLTSYNSGTESSGLFLSSTLTTANRLFLIDTDTEDVTGGTLNVWIEYVIT